MPSGGMRLGGRLAAFACLRFPRTADILREKNCPLRDIAMVQPAVFISCVSPEFRTIRGQVADVLTRLGYTPIKQEIFGTEPGDLREMLRDQIDQCHGLIQIVGHAYGAEPPNVDADFGRVSYTQFEFLYARQRGKKTWLIFAGEACQRDTPLEVLDLPSSDNPGDPATFQGERRRLQDAYRQARQSDGHLYHPVGNIHELLLRVEQIKNELRELREKEKEWKNEVTDTLTTLTEQQRITNEKLTEQQRITKEKIRVHLLEAAAKTHRRALDEADREKGWQRREELRHAADEQQKVRLLRIDDLAASFAEIEGTAKSNTVFDEMTRILAEEGLDQTLAYFAPQQEPILDKVRSRNVLMHEMNRNELQPLLMSAQLYAVRGAFAEAGLLFDEILAFEPDWPDAVFSHVCFLIDRGASARTVHAARADYDLAKTKAQYLLKLDASNITWRFLLSESLKELGEIALAEGDTSRAKTFLTQSYHIIQHLAEVEPGNTEWRSRLFALLQTLGVVWMEQGYLTDAKTLFVESFHIIDNLVQSDPENAQWQHQLGWACINAGRLAVAQGNSPRAKMALGEARRIFQGQAESDPTNEAWQYDLSITLERLGDRALAEENLPEAAGHFDECARIRRRLAETSPASSEWQRSLSVSLQKLGALAEAQGNLPEARTAYAESLRIFEHMVSSDPGNTGWRRDLSVVLHCLGDLAMAEGNLSNAGILFERCLQIRQCLVESNPQNAQWQRDLWHSHLNIAKLLEKLGDARAEDHRRVAAKINEAMLHSGLMIPPRTA